MELNNAIIDCATDVYNELGSGWTEVIYQKAMEVSFRESGIEYDNLRTVTISYKSHIIGDAQIDLLPYVVAKDGIKQYIVVELKAVAKLEEGYKTQAIKYVNELKAQCKPDEVIAGAILINFCNEGKNKKLNNDVQDVNGLQLLTL